MRLTTTGCETHSHLEFVLEADSHVPESHLEDLGQTIEGMVAGGSVFRPKQTFQIGWMVTQVEPLDARRLTLVEPDMKAMPIRWVPGVTETLRQKMVQVFTLDSFSLRDQITMATALQSLVACRTYTNGEFYMQRSESEGSDSGWFVGCLDQNHDHQDAANLRCLSLYEAYLHQPGILNFLLFPVGTMIVNDTQNGITVLNSDDEPLELVSGSFLDAWLKQR